jgi:predicted NBD/HSP70 family sugar kinase
MNIVFDIGGTNMRVAAAQNGELGEIRKVPTPKDPKEGVALFIQIAHELSGTVVGALGGGIAADYIHDGVLSGATNLPQWNGINLVQQLTAALNASVAIVNDTVAAGLGEKMKGAGKGYGRVAYMTVSTGVGAACIGDDPMESPILREVELSIGHLEPQISGTAVRKKFGIDPKDLNSLDERSELADILAAGLGEIAEAWRPDVFVIGGSMIVGVNPIPLERVREKFSAVPVRMAELGDNGGLIGGAILAMQK